MTVHITQEIISELFERQNTELLKACGGLEAFENQFSTDLEEGLSKEEILTDFSLRKRRYGVNVLPAPPTKTWWRLFWAAFKNLTLQILCITAVISLVLAAAFPPDHGNSGGYHFLDFIDPIAVIVCVILVAGTQAHVDYAQQRSFAEINKLKNIFQINVIRGGVEMRIMNTELLVGDILSLKNGDRVAADCLYIKGHSLKVDNSQETGESVAVEVNENKPFVLGGAAVESGDAHMLVCAVGEHSQSGINMMKIQKMSLQKEKSPLERKIEDISKEVTWIGVAGALLTFLCLLIIWIVDVSQVQWKRKFVNDLMEDLMIGLTIFICAVPEGLPLSVTFSLGLSMKWMVKDNIFVRHLSACETMGGATTICSDKTGTLTQNNMTVVRLHIGDKVHDGYPELSDSVKTLLCDAIAINTSAYQNPAGQNGEPGQFVGQSSECALLQMLPFYGADYKLIRENNPIEVLHEFNSTRKRMSTVTYSNDVWRVYVKGAPDYVLQRCTHYLDEDGTIQEFDEEKRNKVVDVVIDMANDALRTMLIAYADLPGYQRDAAWDDPDSVENDLTMICIAGIIDPLRPEVPQAIEMCRKAGVSVRMVTGDYINTAKAIAKQCNILTDDGAALSGLEFSSMSKLELLELLPKLQVIARSSPRDKFRLVSLLMESGEVVAVTGDGSNDAPAMKKSNLGMAMGKCGTELAKMASDIVILDDNFSSIVVALKWGRCTYDNIRAYLTYQLTVNFTAMIIAFIGSCVLKQSPLKAIQLLWTNLVIGAIGALALATSRPKDSLLKRPPYGETDPLVSPMMIRNICCYWAYEVFVCFLVLFGWKSIFGFSVPEGEDEIMYRSTLTFNTFLCCNIVNLLNVRVSGPHMSIWDGILSNWYFNIIFIFLCVLQGILVEFCGEVFFLVSLTWKEWITCVAFAFGTFVIGFLVRLIKVEDQSKHNLELNREEQKQKMREFYHGMTPEQMWNIDNVPENINKIEIDP